MIAVASRSFAACGREGECRPSQQPSSKRPAEKRTSEVRASGGGGVAWGCRGEGVASPSQLARACCLSSSTISLCSALRAGELASLRAERSFARSTSHCAFSACRSCSERAIGVGTKAGRIEPEYVRPCVEAGPGVGGEGNGNGSERLDADAEQSDSGRTSSAFWRDSSASVRRCLSSASRHLSFHIVWGKKGAAGLVSASRGTKREEEDPGARGVRN